jgi:lipid-binding SYLF domain-containing protein
MLPIAVVIRAILFMMSLPSGLFFNATSLPLWTKLSYRIQIHLRRGKYPAWTAVDRFCQRAGKIDRKMDWTDRSAACAKSSLSKRDLQYWALPNECGGFTMQRRHFMITAAIGIYAGVTGLSGCAGTATTNRGKDARTDADKRRMQIDQDADSALGRLYTSTKGSRELAAKASGVLVFPSVIAAGLVIGGQHGNGTLRIGGKTSGYYSLTSASIGLEAGAQSKSIVFLFMTQEALNKFRSSETWRAGVEASVAVAKVGANGMLDISAAGQPVLAFVLTNAGLMANLSLEGTRITSLTL